MPPSAVKTIKDLIFWEYSKLISSATFWNHVFVMHSFRKLKTGQARWSDILMEDAPAEAARCAYCSGTEGLAVGRIVPKRECRFAEIHNKVEVCRTCRSSKGNKDLMAWWGVEKRHELPRAVLSKYLKMLYICHECRGTLDNERVKKDGDADLLDLETIFRKPCERSASHL